MAVAAVVASEKLTECGRKKGSALAAGNVVTLKFPVLIRNKALIDSSYCKLCHK